MTRVLWTIGWAALCIDVLFVASILCSQNGIYPQ
jgi:hypothetical protein